MKMSLKTVFGSPSAAFTLIEMLIVILVISILAALMLPVVMKARSWSREKQAMMEIKNLEIAIKAYRAVYGKWPNQIQAAMDTCYIADNASVIGALTTNNPRGMVFLQFQQSSISTNTGSYLDPWHHPYIIATDDSGDNKVTFYVLGVVLTNLNAKITTNSLNFTGDFTVGVASWGAGDASLSVGQADYLNMEWSSWRSGRTTK